MLWLKERMGAAHGGMYRPSYREPNIQMSTVCCKLYPLDHWKFLDTGDETSPLPVCSLLWFDSGKQTEQLLGQLNI